MADFDNIPESEDESYPLEPRYHPVNRILRSVYDSLASAKLAMFLLVAILLCSVIGVTIFRERRAGEMIFGTLWFNGILILLVINVACCFFGRIWGRRITVISFGMILFHLSFVAILGGIVYNSLFYFRGLIRLTEGESLPNGVLQSYDYVEQGRFFDLTKLKGQTTLVKMHTGYKVKGEDKRAAYEVEVGDQYSKKSGIVYITHNLDYRGFKYLPEKEGYSVLVVMLDGRGKELFGAYVPLQSLRSKEGNYLYTTGTKEGPSSFPFPQEPAAPLLALQLAYMPTTAKERSGEVAYQVWPLDRAEMRPAATMIANGKSAIGSPFRAGEYQINVREVRYWAAMNVRYEPGKPIVLASLWVGLGGMIITTLGRIRQRQRQQRKP